MILVWCGSEMVKVDLRQSFKDLHMILLPFIDILARLRFRKNTLKSDVHSLRRPCTSKEGHHATPLKDLLHTVWSQKPKAME